MARCYSKFEFQRGNTTLLSLSVTLFAPDKNVVVYFLQKFDTMSSMNFSAGRIRERSEIFNDILKFYFSNFIFRSFASQIVLNTGEN